MPIVSYRRHLPAQHEYRNHFLFIFINGFTRIYYDHFTSELAIYAVKTVRDLLCMGIELFVENTMIQVISSLKHDRTPLRDIAEEYFSNPSRAFIDFAYIGDCTYQVGTNSVLMLWIFYCFLHGPRGIKVLQKGVRCLTIARTLRIITFSITILPNPNPNCNFTGPIDPFNLSPGD
jgi:hypothetical protein